MLKTYGEKIRCMTASLVIFTNLLRSDSHLDVLSLKELSTLFSFFSTKAMEEEDSSFGFILAFFFRLTLSFHRTPLTSNRGHSKKFHFYMKIYLRKCLNFIV